MKNAMASLFVLVVLTGCAIYTWENTRFPLLDQPDHGGQQWRDRVRGV